MLRKTKNVVAGAMFTSLLSVISVSSVNAGSVEPFTPLGDSGWSYLTNDPNIELITFNSGDGEAGLFVAFEKSATWYEDTWDEQTQRYLEKTITFSQISPDAAPMNLIISSEAIFNKTAQSWTGFQMFVSDSGGPPSAVFDPAGSVDFDTFPPFATKFFSDDNKTFTSTDGVLVNGPVPWNPAKNLVIYAAANKSGELKTFELKEAPIVGTVAIPLPAAAWSGLSGLLGLGAIGAIRKVRHAIA